jgi:FK506-binding protein 4/5
MYINEKSLFVVRPDYCVGGDDDAGVDSSGNKQKAVGKWRVYEIELLSFTKGRETFEMTTAQKLARVDAKKEQGNALFKRKLWRRGGRRYADALAVVNSTLDFSDDEDKAWITAQAALHANISLCKLREGLPDDALAAFAAVLELDPKHVKTLWRRADLLLSRGDDERALDDLRTALTADPDNAACKRLYAQTRKKRTERVTAQRAAYARGFAAASSDNGGSGEDGDDSALSIPLSATTPPTTTATTTTTTTTTEAAAAPADATLDLLTEKLEAEIARLHAQRAELAVDDDDAGAWKRRDD